MRAYRKVQGPKLPGKRALVAVVAVIAVVGVVLGVVTGTFASLGASGLYATGLWSRNGPSTLPPGALENPGASTEPSPSAAQPSSSVALPRPVLAPAGSAPVPRPAAIAAKIASVKVKDSSGPYSGSVMDVGTGKVLFAHNATVGFIPASTTKLLTTTAALSIMGPDHRFTTSVVSPRAGQIVLVGGGDPYLVRKAVSGVYPSRTSLSDLAGSTAAALRKNKVKRVVLGYDTSLFSGPAWNTLWPNDYSDQVTPTSALWVDEGRVNGGSPGPRVKNPARDAADAFAAALKKRGITVTQTQQTRAPRSSAKVASISSMPLERIVQQLLMVSDNDAAEVLLRQSAIATGGPGSSAAGVQAVRARLRRLGVWDQAIRLQDGSGLARSTRVAADTMVKLLRLDAEEQHPELRAVITGLPVAGVEGSLRIHYSDDASLAGRGVVRGKTGTLSKVHALAGFLRDRDGALLVFAFLINNPKNEYASTVWLDRVTTALSTCGCR